MFLYYCKYIIILIKFYQEYSQKIIAANSGKSKVCFLVSCACTAKIRFYGNFRELSDDKYFFAIVMKSVVDDKHWLL